MPGAVHGMAFADVDVDVADRRLGELAPLGCVVWSFGQPGDAMTIQAAVQAGSSELGDAVAQTSEDVVERQQGAPPEPPILSMRKHAANANESGPRAPIDHSFDHGGSLLRRLIVLTLIRSKTRA